MITYGMYRNEKIEDHRRHMEYARHYRQQGDASAVAYNLEKAAVTRTALFCARPSDFEHRVYGAANSGRR